jgi:membrane protease YdiL (CAAX protease family)
LFLIATFYARQYPSFRWIWTAALPAFLLETLFYLGSVFESTRASFHSVPGLRRRAALLWLSGLVPYLVFALGSGTFHRNAFYLLALLCGVFSFWYVFVPRRFTYDAGFLVIAAAPFLTKVFDRIYLAPDPHLRVGILGHLMWIRLGVIALLVFREWDPGPLSLWPNLREWRIGLRWFTLAILPIAGTALLLHDVRWSPQSGPWWRILGLAVGYFLGALWVVSLAEELFFRGVIEKALLDEAYPKSAAVSISALLFGSVHLWFHHFPNWQRALVAAVLGIACGMCYLQTRSVRASMVTHALTIVIWRILFR